MGRIHLSPPELGEAERRSLLRALDGGWIAPLGPEVDAFEAELASVTGRAHAVALSSGSAALHLALLASGIGEGDRVLVQSMTFAATANAVRYTGAVPVFVDSTAESWNLDPDLVEEAVETEERRGRPIRALVTVDLYGQCADYERLERICIERGITLIEDAAEALGAHYRGRPAGSFGRMATLSFNGNKVITTSGGGALVTNRKSVADLSRHLATQAREPAPHYEHRELGYDYRLSNLLAALGRAQLKDLDRRVERRRSHNMFYRKALADLPGIEFMPEAPGCRSTFWLTALTIDPPAAGTDREAVRLALDAQDIEARPVWKPMHLQPLYAGFPVYGGDVSRRLFEKGLCLPSGSGLSDHDRERVAAIVRKTMGR